MAKKFILYLSIFLEFFPWDSQINFKASHQLVQVVGPMHIARIF